MEKDLQVVINNYLKQFTTKKRGEETIIIFKDNASEELKNSVFEAHGERLPNDWIFSKYQSILADMSGYTMVSMDDIEENRAEIIDGLVDVYTSDLTSWLNDSNYNVYYLTEALEEMEIKDGFKALQMAQYKAIDEIYSEVVNLLENGKEGEE